MISRGTVIATLCVVQLAIVFAAVDAIEGGRLVPSFANAVAPTDTTRLAEDGAHQTFGPGVRALTVDIGNADLTIHGSSTAEVDVSLSSSSDYGMFRSTEPISARQDGDTVRIAKRGGSNWSVGDDRMVDVEVPPDTRVTVLRAGDIKVDGLRAEATIKSSGDGSIAVTDYEAPALRLTSSGSISLQAVTTDWLGATSSDGHVEGSALRIRSGDVESDDHVTLGLSSQSDTLVTAQTADGKVATTGFAADGVTAGPKGDDSDADSASVRIGTATGHLTVHSSDGDIKLSQEN